MVEFKSDGDSEGLIFGENIEDFEENADRVLALLNNDFNTPGPPPQPEFRLSVDNHSVLIDWEVLPSGVNPEIYQDSTRKWLQIDAKWLQMH